MPTPTSPFPDPRTWVERIIDRVAKNEGPDGFNSQNRNRDGQGLSWGIIQWAQGPGSLGKLLQAMNARDPYAFLWIFGEGKQSVVDELLAKTTGARNPAATYINGYRLYDPYWTSKFTAASTHPAFREVQIEEAVNDAHFQAAIRISNILGIDTERALLVFYDASVQHGPNGAPNMAADIADEVAGEDHDSILRAFAEQTWDAMRRATRPAELVTSRGNIWKQVGNEWHLFTKTGADLYQIVRNRREPMLTERGWSSEPVDWHDYQSLV